MNVNLLLTALLQIADGTAVMDGDLRLGEPMSSTCVMKIMDVSEKVYIKFNQRKNVKHKNLLKNY